MPGQMWIFAIFTFIALGVIIWTLVQLPDEEGTEILLWLF